jgi:hypothetical protein
MIGRTSERIGKELRDRGGVKEMKKEDEGSRYKIFVRKPEGRRQLGRPGHRWKDIKMELRRDCVDRIHLAHDMDWWRTLVR